MRLRLIVKTGSVSVALALAVIGLPAMAQEGPAAANAPVMADMHPGGHETLQQPVFSLPPQIREEWLAECSHRLTWRGPHEYWRNHHESWHRHHESWRTHHEAEDSAYAREACETYLDDYYAYYADSYANYVHYAQAAYGLASPCCRKQPDCTETVEYEEVPMRPAARRSPSAQKPCPISA